MNNLNETINKIKLELQNGTDPLEISKKTNISLKIIMKLYRKLWDKSILDTKFARIKELIANKKYPKALEECEEYPYSLDYRIFNKRIFLLIKLKRYKEALKLCNLPYYDNDFAILSYKITALINLKHLKEALEACDDPLATDNCIILSQKITILIKMNDLNAALKLCNEIDYSENEIIATQKIKILIALNRLDEALSMAQDEKYTSNKKVKYFHALILFNLNQEKQALDICNNPLFSNLNQFKKLKNIILELQSMNTSLNSLAIPNENLPLNMANIANITEEEIKTSPLNEAQRLVFLIAFYEYHNYPEKIILTTLKKATKTFQADDNILKIINHLKNRLTNKKKKIFNLDFYLIILEALINLERHNLENMQATLKRLKEQVGHYSNDSLILKS